MGQALQYGVSAWLSHVFVCKGVHCGLCLHGHHDFMQIFWISNSDAQSQMQECAQSAIGVQTNAVLHSVQQALHAVGRHIAWAGRQRVRLQR
jgi:hypothetical protein